MKKYFSKILKCKLFYYLLFIILTFGLYLYNLKYKLTTINHSNNTIMLFGLISLILALILLIILYVFKKIKEEKFYIFYGVIAFVLGLIYIFLAPVYTGSDEHNHFYRIYEITDGKLITKINSDSTVGEKLPVSLVQAFSKDISSLENTNIKYYMEPDKMKIALDKEKTIDYGYTAATSYQNTALYSPLQYLPSIVGVFLGKSLNLGPFWLIIFGRLFNLVFFVLITTIGIKKLPERKLFAAAILISPVVLSGAATLSSDGFTYALIFLFIVYILNYIKTKSKISIGDRIVLLLLVILVSVCKIVYLPIVFLLFLIPKECYKNKKDRWIFNISLLILASIFSLIWMHIVQGLFDSYYIKSDLQKSFIFGNIIEYIFILIRSYIAEFNMIITNLFYGKQLYHSQLDVYPMFSVTYFILVIMLLFKEKSSIKVSNNQKIIIFLVILMIMALVATALYLQHTATWYEIGKNVVTGMQGRYYIPIILLLTFMIKGNNIKKVPKDLLFSFVLLLQFTCFLTMIIQFI